MTVPQLEQLRSSGFPRTGNRVGVAIEIAGVTQRTIARTLGMPEPYVSEVVRGRYRTITVENAHRFADFFGCTVDDLFPRREAAAGGDLAIDRDDTAEPVTALPETGSHRSGGAR